MFVLISHDASNILPSVVENQVVTAWVVVEEPRDVINFASARYPTAGRIGVRRHVLQRVHANSFRHGVGRRW